MPQLNARMPGGIIRAPIPRRISSPDLSAFLLYDDFSGPIASLDGRSPKKGNAWTASGLAAGNMVAGNGRLTQNADILAGYAFNSFGQTVRKIVADWNCTSGEVDYPPTLALCGSTNGATDNFLHGEGGKTGFLIRLGVAGSPVSLIMPGWSLWSPAFSLSSSIAYRTELHYDGDKFAAMVLRSGGEIIGQQVAYDPDMASYVGNWMFAETFDSRMGYAKVTAEAATDYIFPALSIMKETAFASGADGFVGSVFGGSTSWDANGVTITGDTIYQGASIPVGSVVTGDKVYVSYDVTAQSGASVMGLIPTGQTGPVIGAIEGIQSGTGRFTHTFTAEQDTADTCFHMGNAGVGGSSSIALRSLLVIKNPPTN